MMGVGGARRRLGAVVSALAAFALATSSAQAQSSSDASVIGRDLFAQGRALMAKEDFAAACKKFEESQRIDPGGGTLLNLALCHEKLGKTATAWAEFNEALRIARNDGRTDRAEFAKQHVDDLAGRLSRLTVVVPPAARAPDLVVKRNGVELASTLWGEELAVDPGAQLIEISAPGKIGAKQTVVVGSNGDKKTVTLGPLGDAPSPPSRKLALGAIAGGVAALAAGVGFGVRALERQSLADEQCPSRQRCSKQGVDAGDQAVVAGNVSTVFVGSAIVLAAVGTIVLLAQPSTGAKQTARGRATAGALPGFVSIASRGAVAF